MLAPPERKHAITITSEIKTDGHSPLLVITDDYNKYLVKSTRANVPGYFIINEFLCAYLLQLWEIPVPEFSSVVVDPALIIQERFTQFHKPHFYKTITFGSKWLETGVELTQFSRIYNKADLRKYVNPFDLIKIGLFDIWVENTDRKPTNPNIILSIAGNQLTVMAIDHAFTFDSVGYADLNPAYINNTYNENILETRLIKDILSIKRKDPDWKQWVDNLRSNYYLCIDNCRKNFETITEYIPAELGYSNTLSICVRDFLFNDERNKMVFTEFLSRIS